MRNTFNVMLAMMIIIIAGFVSCKKDKTDVPAAVEGLTAHPGKNRAEVEFAVPPNAIKGKVFFGSGNYKEFTVTDASAPQKVIVEELNEQEHTLRVVTINGDGMVSDPRAVKVKVYGANYESGLKPRKWVDQVTHSANSLEFKFDNAVASETGVRIKYTNTGGNDDSVTMSNAANSIAVDNIDTTKPYYYFSLYKPEAAAIDDFHSSPVDLKTALMLDFKKSGWKILEASGNDPEHVPASVIDNDPDSYWLSDAAATLPHSVTIDMESPKYIDGFYFLNPPGVGGGATNLKVELSADNVNWTTALQADVTESYFRQRLPLSQTAIARYIKLSVLETRVSSNTQSGFVEIDAYNVQNVSGDNGYTSSTPVSLVNAKAPFTGDGSNPFPALGAFRMQKLSGWTHSANAVVTYDNLGPSFSMFIAPVWGLPEVENGKVFQAVDLEAGAYILKVLPGGADGPAQVYGVVTSDNALPNYSNVPTASNVMSYANMVDYQNKSVEMRITVPQAMKVYIGFVYNLKSQYAQTGLPWTSFKINELNLVKAE